MIRKPPLRTYQRKKNAQTSYNYSQASLREPRSYSKRISTSGKKSKPVSTLDHRDIEDISSDYLDTTFDRIAKNVRLPPAPQQESCSLLDVSSDVPEYKPPPVVPDVHEPSWKIGSPKAKTRKRPKRKATQTRILYDDTDAVVKKRLKNDLMNLSTKKAKANRNTKRKVSAKTVKSGTNSEQKLTNDIQESELNNSDDWFDVQPAKINGIENNPRKQKTRYPLRRRNNVPKKLNSYSSDSNSGSNRDAGINKAKTKSKKSIVSKFNSDKKETIVFDSINGLLNESSGFLYVKVEDGECLLNKFQDKEKKESFLVDSSHSVNTSKSGNISNRTRSRVALRNSPALEYVRNFRRYSALKSRQNKDVDKIKISSEICQNDGRNEENPPIESCSVQLPIGTQNKRSNLRNKKSATVVRHMHSTTDIFQSSISSTSLNIGTPAFAVIENKSQEHRESEGGNNLNHDSKRFSIIVTDHDSRASVRRRVKSDANQSSYHLKCSTPINTHVKINKSMNRLSPITYGDETCSRIENIGDEKEAAEPSVLSYKQQYSEVTKLRTRRKIVRKKLSISYEEDKSLAISDEYCKENEGAKTPIYGKSDKSHSPTSGIQESLEILRLDSINKHDTDNNDKLFRSSLKETRGVLNGSKGSSVVFESMNTCSQLTPAGILTTRSGRQLRLSNSMQKEFLNDTENKINHETSKFPDDQHSESVDIVENSEVEKIRILTDKINKKRGSKFSVSKSHSQSESQDINTSKTPDDSSFHYLMGRNSSRKLQSMSVNNDSKFSTRDNGISQFSSVNRSNGMVSVTPDAGNEYTTSSTQRMLESMIESIKCLGSLDITSQVDVKEENTRNSVCKENNSDSEWNTLSSNDDLTNELKSEYSANTDAYSDTDWSTLSSNNLDSTKSNGERMSTRLSSRSSRRLTNSYGSKTDESLTNNASNRSIQARLSSPESTSIAEMERNKLLSCRITTRKRTKTFLKYLEKSKSETVDEPVVNQDSSTTNTIFLRSKNGSDLKEDKATENFIDSIDRATDFDLFKHPLDVNSGSDLQPLVLVKKLDDPLRITAKDRQDYNLGLTPIREISNEILLPIPQDSIELFVASGNELVMDNEEFEKSDPLYLPPRRSERTNSKKTKTDSKSKSKSKQRVAQLNVSKSKKLGRDSMSASIGNVALKRSKRSSKSKSNKLSPLEFKRRVSKSKLNVSETEVTERPSLFLKPGKDWARSLSILNNIQNGSDLDRMSTGKGKNWRMSVQAILDMQQQQQDRVVQSCLGKNGDDKETQPRFKSLNCAAVPETTPCSEEPSIGSASPGRFIRRMSIRVVPDKKRITHIEDSSFLEAYGITPSKSRKSLTRRSELEHKETTVRDTRSKDFATDTPETDRLITARDVVLQRCSQDDYLPFAKCFPTEYLENCTKIGEGVYGEVFLHEHEDDKSVIKIIPIEGNALVNGERQKRFDEILSEIVIARELHDLRNDGRNQTHGFVEVRNIRCISGKYPDKLIELWKAYDDDKGSDNDCPSMFDEHQLYIVLELGHGGQDLEAFVFHSAAEAHALFVQAAFALAVAEQSLEFEHRDLHWGNVLISETKDVEVSYKLNDKVYSYPTRGLQVAIIDFTLSRMSYDGCCIFNDLALDPALFTAQGEYQFEIYRLMRDKVGNNWQQFEPYTNLLWLHYTIDKMMTAARYKRKYAKAHREAMFWFHELKDEILNYKSAFDFVTNCEKIKTHQCQSATETTTTFIKMDCIKIDS